jgi:hypothetical protein
MLSLQADASEPGQKPPDLSHVGLLRSPRERLSGQPPLIPCQHPRRIQRRLLMHGALRPGRHRLATPSVLEWAVRRALGGGPARTGGHSADPEAPRAGTRHRAGRQPAQPSPAPGPEHEQVAAPRDAGELHGRPPGESLLLHGHVAGIQPTAWSMAVRISALPYATRSAYRSRDVGGKAGRTTAMRSG